MPPKQHMKIKFIYGVTLPRLHAQAEALIKNATKAMVKKHVVSKILEVWCGGIIKGAYYHTPNGGLRPPFPKKTLTIRHALPCPKNSVGGKKPRRKWHFRRGQRTADGIFSN